MEWRPYAACCHRHALDADSAFCGECGRLLLRCMAFQECMSLVTPTDPCPVCIAPRLFLDRGAVTRSNVGERLSIPLVFCNTSKVHRPIRVEAMTAQNDGRDTPIALDWEQVDAEAERGLTVETPSLDHAGIHTVRVVATLASRYKGREERYAFASNVKLSVEAPEQLQLVQNINLSGAQFETGGMVHAPVSLRPQGQRAAAQLREREALPLERAERYEIEHGIRGYVEGALRVPRTAAFVFTGFPASDRPADGATIGQRGALACGRASLRYDAEVNPLPSDLSLRIYKRAGELDEQATVFISRHHFDLLVMNDRLCVQLRGANGLQVNDRKLAAGAVETLRDGDRIVPLPGHPDKLALRVRFRTSFGNVERIEIAREPALRQ